jgi:hypothetical protein
MRMRADIHERAWKWKRNPGRRFRRRKPHNLLVGEAALSGSFLRDCPIRTIERNQEITSELIKVRVTFQYTVTLSDTPTLGPSSNLFRTGSRQRSPRR